MSDVVFGLVPVTVRVRERRSLSPFHKTLLASLGLFPPGRRPDVSALTQKLCVLEPRFFAEAWSDLVAWRAVDHDSLALAHRTEAGEVAWQRGVWSGEVRDERSYDLAFDLETGATAAGLDDTSGTQPWIGTIPAWVDRLSISEIEGAVRAQCRGRFLEENEEVESFSLDWSRARTIEGARIKKRKE